MNPTSHTLSVFTENQVGLLGRVTGVFARRSVNIESLTVSESEIPGIHRFTISVFTTTDMANKIALQLEKQVDVIKAFVHRDEELVFRDLALCKVATTYLDANSEQVIRNLGGRVVAREPEYWVVECTGTEAQNTALLTALTPLGVLEFARTGRVALMRPAKALATTLEEATRYPTLTEKEEDSNGPDALWRRLGSCRYA